jgi:hypothetical protein
VTERNLKKIEQSIGRIDSEITAIAMKRVKPSV